MKNPKIPEAYSYYAIRGKNKRPVMVFAKAQRHTAEFTGSEGAFIQNIGWEWNEQLVSQNMDMPVP